MKWARTEIGRYVSGEYTLIPIGLRSRREGYAVHYRGKHVDSRPSLARAKARAERHRTTSVDNINPDPGADMSTPRHV